MRTGEIWHSDEFMTSRGWRKERIEMFQNVQDARKFVNFNMLLEKRSRPEFEIGFTIKKLWGKYYVSMWKRR
jgi:hypothetical protein